MGNKPWRASKAKKMPFDEMTARARYEWGLAEKAEAEAEHYEKECASLRSQLAEAEARGRNEALEDAARVLDSYGEYDAHLCCDGRECACGGETVHESIQHYIRELITKPTDSEETQ